MTFICIICDEFLGYKEIDHVFYKPVIIKCGHVFHDFCLRKWLDKVQPFKLDGTDGNCPTCKSNVQTHDITPIYLSEEEPIQAPSNSIDNAKEKEIETLQAMLAQSELNRIQVGQELLEKVGSLLKENENLKNLVKNKEEKSENFPSTNIPGPSSLKLNKTPDKIPEQNKDKIDPTPIIEMHNTKIPDQIKNVEKRQRSSSGNINNEFKMSKVNKSSFNICQNKVNKPTPAKNELASYYEYKMGQISSELKDSLYKSNSSRNNDDDMRYNTISGYPIHSLQTAPINNSNHSRNSTMDGYSAGGYQNLINQTQYKHSMSHETPKINYNGHFNASSAMTSLPPNLNAINNPKNFNIQEKWANSKVSWDTIDFDFKKCPSDEIIEIFGVTENGFERGESIIWPKNQNNSASKVHFKGVIIWLGKINGIVNAGIHFDQPIGDFSGYLKDKKLFSGDIKHCRLVPCKEILQCINSQ